MELITELRSSLILVASPCENVDGREGEVSSLVCVPDCDVGVSPLAGSVGECGPWWSPLSPHFPNSLGQVLTLSSPHSQNSEVTLPVESSELKIEIVTGQFKLSPCLHVSPARFLD